MQNLNSPWRRRLPDRFGSIVARRLAAPNRWPAPVHHRIMHARDLPVPAADGVVLRTDVWSPHGVADPDVVLVRSPYGRRGLVGWQFGRQLAGQGFRVVIQSCRGTDGSGGDFRQPFATEVDDGAATVAWLRRQPWFPGRFATVGSSYLGYTQLAVAMSKPAELAAMVLQFAPTDLRSVVYPDGVLGVQTALGWAEGASRDPRFTVRNMIGLARHGKERAALVEQAARTSPLATSYRIATRADVPFFEEWMANSPDSEWWDRFDVRPALDSIGVPVLVQGGWYDVFSRDSLSQWETLRDREIPVSLTMGAWIHGSIVASWSQLVSEAAEWLRTTLGTTPTPDRPARETLRLQAQPRGHWFTAASWPPPGTSEKTWRLPTDGGWTFDPAEPTPSIGGNYIGDGAGPTNHERSLEARSDTFVFTAEDMGCDAAVAGSPVVRLTVTATAPSFDVVARLCLVDADGESTNLTDGLTRVPPGSTAEPREVHVTLAPAFAVLRAGERLRLVLTGGAHPRWLRNPGTGVDAAFASELRSVNVRIGAASTLAVPLASTDTLTELSRPGQQGAT